MSFSWPLEASAETMSATDYEDEQEEDSDEVWKSDDADIDAAYAVSSASSEHGGEARKSKRACVSLKLKTS